MPDAVFGGFTLREPGVEDEYSTSVSLEARVAVRERRSDEVSASYRSVKPYVACSQERGLSHQNP